MKLAEDGDFQIGGVVIVGEKMERDGETGAGVVYVVPVTPHTCVESLLRFSDIDFPAALTDDGVGDIL